jgi:hypothetical protein
MNGFSFCFRDFFIVLRLMFVPQDREPSMVGKIAAIAILTPLAIACAPFAAASAPALNAGQTALIKATCEQVMGLKPGSMYRSQCEDSLSRSLSRKIEAASMADNYSACGNQGLSNGTPAFAACVLDRQEKSQPPAAVMPVRLSYDATTPENAKSYFDVPPSVRWRREQYSCVQLSLVPSSLAFGQCVASLDAALFSPH